ncbi:hypothetical protein [Paraburkholderia pallida]|uniref:Lipoprotein n=1 Tax=Paraburkholderia pallida TaxID=2547399 RepID=A0A4P7D1A4_9BURK|nr:hypothetical protein [Paraburkholderia pallida]QBR01618.1 hypothetical protein E1956_31100 [Paraburkholderia pallida]
MKLLRTLILLLLCAVLPLSGLAATGMAGDCPMQQSMSMPMHGDGAASVSMPGCDMAKSSSPGKAKGVFCKATAQCQFASIYYPAVPVTVSRPVTRGSPVVFHYTGAFTGRAPAGLWRPPRAV